MSICVSVFVSICVCVYVDKSTCARLRVCQGAGVRDCLLVCECVIFAKMCVCVCVVERDSAYSRIPVS